MCTFGPLSGCVIGLNRMLVRRETQGADGSRACSCSVQVPRAADASRPAAPARKTPAKRKAAASAPRAVPPAAIPPKAAETKNSTVAPPAEQPQHLSRILSADEKAEYQSAYERSSAAAREMLKTLSGRQLAPDTCEFPGSHPLVSHASAGSCVF